eukprot:TRINITY_DN6707_c0_g2_i4.p2 TRINITY_DN6707_c0_g2~~TRINITY_DN6707_c0_g2_i4.p2  ORF type:complete len:100 (-),score=12.41 TRINITY_DN6707_c0_g2_i4:586-885(-)
MCIRDRSQIIAFSITNKVMEDYSILTASSNGIVKRQDSVAKRLSILESLKSRLRLEKISPDAIADICDLLERQLANIERSCRVLKNSSKKYVTLHYSHR